ncbi:MAG: chorismate mutase [Candidatus Saganbacteria bacterium]|uniref:chorismate mutase n=1 Tax=Candidatus Saganbacteria bacterium TaxID=2575572 RepID=A0A833NZQ4_UNCSA|nr:MAG: chorismate mutase [Candidatus Saganbacteria bacterium]
MLRGIRGAVTAKKNSKDEIIKASTRLLSELISKNNLRIEDIASIFFTATADLKAEFPAKAARLIGLDTIPLLCSVEINVPKSLKKCIRILMLVNSTKTIGQIKHIYLDGAQVLRREFSS